MVSESFMRFGNNNNCVLHNFRNAFNTVCEIMLISLRIFTDEVPLIVSGELLSRT